MAVATTVIIPARNEEATIGKIVWQFNLHPETYRNVYVGIDEATVDDTAPEVWKNGGCSYHTGKHGKGQVVAATLAVLKNEGQLSKRIILCDGDYTGLTQDHISRILRHPAGMTIGIPEFPQIPVPEHVINAWPLVSGFRYLPTSLIPDDAHGYLLETQLNTRVIARGLPIYRVMMSGLEAPFQWPLTSEREAARRQDQEWGRRHGIL